MPILARAAAFTADAARNGFGLRRLDGTGVPSVTPFRVLHRGSGERFQLEDWVVRCHANEGLHFRGYENREVALHGRFESVEVGLKQRRLLRIGHGAQAKPLPEASLSQRGLSGSLGVAYPLRASAWRDQVALAVQFEQVDGRRIQLARLASTHLKQIVVLQSETQANKKSEGAVKEALNLSWLSKFWRDR